MLRTTFVSVLAIALLATGCLSHGGSHTWPTIADHDFYNHTYSCDRAKVTLKNGQYREHGKLCNEFWWLAFVDYSDIDSDGEKEAIVSLRHFPCGSILWADDIFIFKMVKGQLHQIAHLWQEDLESIAIVDGTLVVVASFWTETDAHCCPSQTERAVFAMKEGKLEKIRNSFTKIERK